MCDWPSGDWTNESARFGDQCFGLQSDQRHPFGHRRRRQDHCPDRYTKPDTSTALSGGPQCRDLHGEYLPLCEMIGEKAKAAMSGGLESDKGFFAGIVCRRSPGNGLGHFPNRHAADR